MKKYPVKHDGHHDDPEHDPDAEKEPANLRESEVQGADRNEQIAHHGDEPAGMGMLDIVMGMVHPAAENGQGKRKMKQRAAKPQAI